MKTHYFLIFVSLLAMSCGLTTREVDKSMLQTRTYEGNPRVFVMNEDDPYSGLAHSYYTDGQIKETAAYEAGILGGTCMKYYSNGQTSETREYEDGKQNGPFVAYDFDGVPIKEGTYVNDLPDGTFTSYENGLPYETIEFADGLCHHIYLMAEDGQRLGFEFSRPVPLPAEETKESMIPIAMLTFSLRDTIEWNPNTRFMKKYFEYAGSPVILRIYDEGGNIKRECVIKTDEAVWAYVVVGGLTELHMKLTTRLSAAVEGGTAVLQAITEIFATEEEAASIQRDIDKVNMSELRGLSRAIIWNKLFDTLEKRQPVGH